MKTNNVAKARAEIARGLAGSDPAWIAQQQLAITEKIHSGIEWDADLFFIGQEMPRMQTADHLKNRVKAMLNNNLLHIKTFYVREAQNGEQFPQGKKYKIIRDVEVFEEIKLYNAIFGIPQKKQMPYVFEIVNLGLHNETDRELIVRDKNNNPRNVQLSEAGRSYSNLANGSNPNFYINIMQDAAKVAICISGQQTVIKDMYVKIALCVQGRFRKRDLKDFKIDNISTWRYNPVLRADLDKILVDFFGTIKHSARCTILNINGSAVYKFTRFFFEATHVRVGGLGLNALRFANFFATNASIGKLDGAQCQTCNQKIPGYFLEINEIAKDNSSNSWRKWINVHNRVVADNQY